MKAKGGHRLAVHFYTSALILTCAERCKIKGLFIQIIQNYVKKSTWHKLNVYESSIFNLTRFNSI